jgi:hypothetical protein
VKAFCSFAGELKASVFRGGGGKMTNDDAQHALDFPERYLWSHRVNGSLTAIGRDRLFDLYYGEAVPETLTEKFVG